MKASEAKLGGSFYGAKDIDNAHSKNKWEIYSIDEYCKALGKHQCVKNFGIKYKEKYNYEY